VVSFALPVGTGGGRHLLRLRTAIFEDLGLIEARTLAALVLVSIGLFALIITPGPSPPGGVC